MKESFDVLIVGIGGQGVILTSNVLGEGCLIEGRSVRAAETHGMAQRGGSVECHVRIDGQFGPLIPAGTADLMIAFDLLEALRYRHFLAPGGKMILNDHIVVPTSVYTRKLEIPTRESVLEALSGSDLTAIDAGGIAEEAGNVLARNIVMIGAASSLIPLKEESLLGAVRRNVPQKTVEINIRAFKLGREAFDGQG